MTATEDVNETRTGRFVQQPEGYVTFIPWGLPPEPPVALDPELWFILSQADQSLGRLDGSADTLPNPDLFISMYLRNEAALSCYIEGSQASLRDILEFEAGAGDPETDVKQAVSCLAAINHGLELLKDTPMSLRLILACHKQLFSGAFQGKEKYPGRFRPTQNYIGAPGSTLQTARYIPPPPHKLDALLENLVEFFHDDSQVPSLVKAGLLHAQFESIHPFEDGNGPLGRLLITLFLIETGVLKRPLLYLSYYFKHHRKEYYDRLQAVRDHGDWENWLKFFLRGVYRVSQKATETARQIVDLRESHWRTIAVQLSSAAGNALALLEDLYQCPIISVNRVSEITHLASPDARKLVAKFQKLGLLREITGRHRGQRFAYEPYLALFSDLAPSEPDPETPSPEEDTNPPAQIKTA